MSCHHVTTIGTPTSAQLRRTKFTGIQYVPCRGLQPYSVWCNGKIAKFCTAIQLAETSLQDNRLVTKPPSTLAKLHHGRNLNVTIMSKEQIS